MRRRRILSAKLKAALDYAELGYRVFPCKVDGKEPATLQGCLDATTDPQQIEQWWTANPDLNVAIATDGWLVLDIDPEGKQWLGTVETDDLMRGSMAVTPRGGCHYWFRQNGTDLHNTAGRIARGVDTRANGGYVLVPPSVVNGKPYQWLEELHSQQPSIPPWLLESLGTRQKVYESIGEEIPEGTRNSALLRYAGLMRRGGMTAAEILPSLLELNTQRCKPPLSDAEVRGLARRAAGYEPDSVEQAIILSHYAPQADNGPKEPEEPLAGFPVECINEMPAVMREAYDWMLDSAIKPQPEITLGALLALFGAAFGQKITDDYGTRTNVMVLGIAPSGAGKEHPRQCNKELMMTSGMEMVNGPERIGSHAGIVSSVNHHPVRLFQLDEIGRLLATMRDPKVSHLYNVGTVLMALYSSSNTIWIGDAYADLSKIKTIHQPHVCVFGTSVPESLYGGLSPENLTDGLVGRLIIFQSLDTPKRQKPKQRINAPPFRVTETLREWTQYKPPGSGNLCSGNPIEAQKTTEANDRHEQYCNLVNDKHQQEDNIASAVWSRATEKAAKLALIYACCEAPRADFYDPPSITLAAENWGIKLANYSTRLVLQAARNAVSSNTYEANQKYVFAAISGDTPLTELSRRTRRLKQRERLEILADLCSIGAIELVNVGTEGRPQKVYRKRKNTVF